MDGKRRERWKEGREVVDRWREKEGAEQRKKGGSEKTREN
jgi:hypothetical protein